MRERVVSWSATTLKAILARPGSKSKQSFAS